MTRLPTPTPGDARVTPPAPAITTDANAAGASAPAAIEAAPQALPMTLSAQALAAAPEPERRRVLTTLVLQSFESAPLQLRTHMLERLLGSVGVLSLVTVAGGLFAKMRLRGAGEAFQVRIEDVQNLQMSDLAALVDRVQMAGLDGLNSLAQLLAGSPWLASSAAAAALVSLFLRRRALRLDPPED